MSTEIMNTIVNEPVVNVPTTKVMRSLPAKYNKFASFAFWLLREMKENAILSSVTYDNTCSMMHLLSGDIPLQIEFYERFFSEMKVSDRFMKSEIRSYKENNKNKKTKETKPKKSRNNKKNSNNTDNTDDIISLIVRKANGIDDQPIVSDANNTETVVSVVEKVEKKKRVKKPKSEEPVLQSEVVESNTLENQTEEPVLQSEVVENQSEEPVLQSEVVENQTQEKVEKKKRVKKPKTDETVLQSEVVESVLQSEETNNNSGVEITLHAVTVDGVEYFYDSDNHLYNSSSYEIIGSIDIQSLSISIV